MNNIIKHETNNKPEKHQDGFVIIPRQFAKDKKLNLEERFLLGIVYALSSEKGYCYASNEYFSEEYGLEPYKLQRLINKLIEKKYLVRHVTKKNTSKWTTQRRLYVNYKIAMVEGNKSVVSEGNKSATLEGNKSVAYNRIDKNIDYKDSIYTPEKNEVELNDEDKELLFKYFQPLNADIEKDNRFINVGKRPMIKYPDIWLTLQQFKSVRDSILKAKVSPASVFDKVANKLTSYRSVGRSIETVCCCTWLSGWALDAVIDQEAKNLKLNFYRNE